MARVVSLIASSTEIVCALGCARQLVGISHECDFPPEVLHLPRCTATKFPTDGTSYDIDQRVRAIVAEGLSVYRVDAERLRALRPDVIITQTQCEVCAVSPRDLEAAACTWMDPPPRIISLHPDRLSDIWDDIRRAARGLQVLSFGETLIAELRARMETIAGRAARLRERPRVAYIEWIDPLMAGGNWMPELIAMAGGVNLFGEAGCHSPGLAWEAFCAGNPDVIVIAPCGFDMARSQHELPILMERPEWLALRAVQSGCVFVADGNQFFNRPGPRVVESLEVLAEILHPQHFHFGHEGTGWQRVG